MNQRIKIPTLSKAKIENLIATVNKVYDAARYQTVTLIKARPANDIFEKKIKCLKAYK